VVLSSRDVADLYSKYIMKQVADPVVLTEGQGVYVIDNEGKKYLDFSTGYSVMALGYGNQRVNQSMVAQIEKLVHCCYYLHYSVPAVLLAEKLSQILGAGLKKTFFCTSGTEAVEGAMRLARKHSRRYEIVALFRGHHGRSMGAATLAGNWQEKKSMGPYVPGVVHAPAPYCYRCSLRQTYPECGIACAQFINDLIDHATSNEVGALVIEPVMTDVVIVPPDEYFEEIKKICRERDLLLVVDEVQTCLGRTGRAFAFQHWNLEPDIAILGKAVSAGIPLGAYTSTDEVASSFEFLDFAASMGGNPVACAAGLETIKIIEEEGLVQHTKKMGDYFVTRLKELAENHNCVGEVRGKGFIIGLELVRDQKGKKVAIEEALEVKRYLRENGLLVVLNESTLRILPPFITEEQHIDNAVELIDKSLEQIDKRSR
jgi:4-aminobutyrate aminotransferase/(S)-3-amino-2-methylpropionate transaminase